MRCWSKRWITLVYVQTGYSAICSDMFRSSLNRPLPEITFLQYALASILRSLSAGVVYGASLICCVIVHNGVILKWQRLKIELYCRKKESMNSRIDVVLFLANNWSNHFISAEENNDIMPCIQSFFRTHFKPKICIFWNIFVTLRHERNNATRQSDRNQEGEQ